MKWTTEKPTEPGWYWMREIGKPQFPPIIRQVKRAAPLGVLVLVTWSSSCVISEIDYAEWAGPIELPE